MPTLHFFFLKIQISCPANDLRWLGEIEQWIVKKKQISIMLSGHCWCKRNENLTYIHTYIYMYIMPSSPFRNRRWFCGVFICIWGTQKSGTMTLSLRLQEVGERKQNTPYKLFSKIEAKTIGIRKWIYNKVSVVQRKHTGYEWNIYHITNKFVYLFLILVLHLKRKCVNQRNTFFITLNGRRHNFTPK